MTKGKRGFQPGQSGNPKGRPPLPKDLRDAKMMNKRKFAELLMKYLTYSLDELKELKSRKDTPSLERIVIAVITNAISKGDERRLDFLMTRIIGKAKDELDITTKGEKIGKKVQLNNLSIEELESLAALMGKAEKE